MRFRELPLDELNRGDVHYRTIFLSDIHLGAKACQAERLLSFLKLHSCDQLYLVGDIIDGWRMEASLYWPQAHNNVVRQLLTIAKRGTVLTYITGNHDEFLRSYSDLSFGNISVVDEAVHETAGGERLLVLHGDQFDLVTRRHRWLASLGDLGYRGLLHLNRALNFLRRKLGYSYWSLSASIKQRVKQAVNHYSSFEQALSYECRRRAFDGVVCGHIHKAEISRIAGAQYMNCGDWVESCTALVEDAEGKFRIVDWSPARTQIAVGAPAVQAPTF